MQDEHLASLAGAECLPVEIIDELWRRGGRRTRNVLAGRQDLPDDIVETIITAEEDGETLVKWLSVHRSPGLVGRIAAGRFTEVDRALARQNHLTVLQKETLSCSGDVDVLKPLLLRGDLDDEQRDRALVAYVTRERILRSTYGEELLRTIEAYGDDDQRWVRLMQVVGPEQAGLVAEAAELGARRPLVAEAASRALVRIAGEIPGRPDQLATQDLHRAARLLLRSPLVPVEDFARLADIPSLVALETLLRRRAELDVAGALRLLTCDGDPSLCGPGHPGVVAVMAIHLQEIAMPAEILPGAALTHADELPESIIERILGHLHVGPELLERERRLGNVRNQVHIIEARQDLYDPCGDHPEEVLSLLAARGARLLLGRHVPAKQRAASGSVIVLEHFQPANQLLEDPYYASLLAERLQRLRTEEREVVYRLLGEWEGNLPDLVAAARSFN